MTLGERTIWIVEIEVYVDGVGETVLRYSDEGYTSLPGDTPASTKFPAVLDDPGSLSQTLFASGTTYGEVDVGYGTIDLDNGNGRLDALRTYGYGRPVRVWSITTALARAIPFSLAVLRFSGVVAYVEAVGFDVIRLFLRDELGRLDVGYMPAVFDGSSTSTTGIEGNGNLEGQTKRAAFGGFIRNFTPALVNASKEVYAWNHGIDGATARSASLEALRNGGATYTLSGTDHASEAALFAATVGAATADTALAESLLRVSGAVTAGLTADAYVAPEVENLILRSEEADLAAWTKSGVTVTADAATAPDGADTADKLVEDSSTAAEHRYGQAITVTAGDPVVGNFYLEAGERTKARVRWSGASGSAYVDVDLAAGTIGTAAATGSYTGATAEIEAAGSAFRVSVLCTTATDTSVTLAALLADGAGSVSYDGDGSSGLYAWGAMGIIGTEVKPYIPTEAAAVTRRCEGTAARVAEAAMAAHGFAVEADSVLELDRKAPYTVAIYLDADWTILEVVRRALESVGAGLIATSTGAFRFVRFEAPTCGEAPMANVILARPNWVAGSNFATPSIGAGYGSWEATMPATEVLTPYLAEPARSTDATAASTKIRINLGTPRDVAVVAIPKSNVSTFGQIRITAYSDAGYSVAVYEGDLVDYWPDVYPWGSRPWASEGLVSSKITPEAADGYPANYYLILPSVVIAQYWQIEIVDEDNDAGYVEIARVVLSPAWQSSINFLPGQSTIQWETASTVRKGRTGVRFVDRKPSRRVTRLAFDLLGEDEAFAQPFEMARKEDLDGEVFVITDPDDTTLALQRAFLANLRVLPSLSYGIIDYMSVAVEVEEVL